MMDSYGSGEGGEANNQPVVGRKGGEIQEES
jgi:hypothetical protein